MEIFQYRLTSELSDFKIIFDLLQEYFFLQVRVVLRVQFVRNLSGYKRISHHWL